jgi:hypothetical protein
MPEDRGLKLAIYPVNPVILSEKLSCLRVFGENSLIEILKIMQNKANFPRFHAKHRDSAEKQSQNKANQSQFKLNQTQLLGLFLGEDLAEVVFR